MLLIGKHWILTSSEVLLLPMNDLEEMVLEAVKRWENLFLLEFVFVVVAVAVAVAVVDDTGKATTTDLS
jgi:hypothetical protein